MHRNPKKRLARKCPICKLMFQPMTESQYVAALGHHVRTARHRTAIEALGTVPDTGDKEEPLRRSALK